MSLFPIIQPETAEQTVDLPLCREVKWDYENNIPVWRGGEPVIVSGAQAVLSWAYRALQVPRYRFAVYTWGYGNECESLIGTAYTDELKQAEAARYVRECLLVHPYISEVSEVRVKFDEGALRVSCVLETVYGEVDLDV